ncbi:hypothetical protein [Fischerella sp. PCC 9605]|uniref:hypothetical protein n=1 Tax=Fischerella sp. PCC 9605 TaxID=1173024 RepID=UPI0004BB1E04|nr:hypothetical protein [Fischerella sp. PCC 9605]
MTGDRPHQPHHHKCDRVAAPSEHRLFDTIAQSAIAHINLIITSAIAFTRV